MLVTLANCFYSVTRFSFLYQFICGVRPDLGENHYNRTLFGQDRDFRDLDNALLCGVVLKDAPS